MTGNSLAKLSLAQRMSADTTRRPTVRLIARNNSVPMTAKLTERTSTVPDEAMPKEMAMMIQPLVSSRMAEATMIWPMSRRMKFISRTTTATILIEEIDSAVARNSAVTRRALALGRIESGSISPSAKPQTKGSATPAAATVIADRPTRRTSRKSVSMPVSSSSRRMPSCETAATMLFCSAVCGNSVCCRSGADDAEHRRAEQQPAEQLSHHRRLAEALHQLAEQRGRRAAAIRARRRRSPPTCRKAVAARQRRSRSRR